MASSIEELARLFFTPLGGKMQKNTLIEELRTEIEYCDRRIAFMLKNEPKWFEHLTNPAAWREHRNEMVRYERAKLAYITALEAVKTARSIRGQKTA